MCDSPSSDQENVEGTEDEVPESALLNIPVEIFLHICSFLDARFITSSLSLVCKHFHAILSDESIWKSRIAKHLNSVYPTLPVESDNFKWGIACAHIEDEYNMWHNKEDTMKRVLLKDIHYASVDAILLMKSGSLCFSGSRDHNLVAWDLNDPAQEAPKCMKPNAHTGWIWNLASYCDTLYSCSWDATVKGWDIEKGLQETSVFQCKHPALALVCSPNLVAVGLFNRRVMLFDPRSQTSHETSYNAHTGAVLALTMVNGYIVSASEDKTLVVWDQRSSKILKRMPLPVDPTINSYPMSMSFADNILYVGDVRGQLHLVNPAGGEFEIVESFDVGHTGKMTGIQHNPGSVMTSSTDGTMRILSPTRTFEPITVIRSQGGEITKFDYKNNVLAMGTTECLVEVWMPKSFHEK